MEAYLNVGVIFEARRSSVFRDPSIGCKHREVFGILSSRLKGGLYYYTPKPIVKGRKVFIINLNDRFKLNLNSIELVRG